MNETVQRSSFLTGKDNEQKAARALLDLYPSVKAVQTEFIGENPFKKGQELKDSKQKNG